MELGLVLTLCGLGGIFLLVAVICYIVLMRRTKYCTADAVALVTEIRTSSSGDDLSFHPVYEYQVAGQTYVAQGGYLSNHVPRVGSQIEIKYNPENPKKSYILNYDEKIYKILSFVFGIIGCIPILICIGIAIFS